MELLESHWIDIALNMLSYLLAAGFTLTIYSLFQRKRPVVAEQGASDRMQAAEESNDHTPDPVTRANLSGSSFVSLRDDNIRSQEAPASPDASRATTERNHHDRRDIIRLARELAKAGTAPEIIKKTLPISDGELALLQRSSQN